MITLEATAKRDCILIQTRLFYGVEHAERAPVIEMTVSDAVRFSADLDKAINAAVEHEARLAAERRAKIPVRIAELRDELARLERESGEA